MDTRFDRKGWQAGTEQVGINKSMVGRISLGEVFEASAGPIEVATVHDHTADAGAMSADEFGGAMHDDVRAPFEWTEEIRGGQRVIDQHRNLIFFCNLCDF